MLVAGYEFFGTMMLVYAIIMSGGNLMGVVFTFFCLLQILGPVSGGHMNPAVSLGVFIREGKGENAGLFVMIVIAQFIGAFCGVALCLDELGSDSLEWRKKHPSTSIPEEWMPTVCPIDTETMGCAASGRAF